MNIAITSPAGKVDSEKLARGVSFLESLGHVVSLGKTLISEEFWCAGSAELRAAELESFWLDQSVDVVWAARGGFGSIQVLDKLSWDKMATSSKILCGHSDITILHLAFFKMGLKRTVSAAMPAVEFAGEVDELTQSSTFDLINSPSQIDLDEFRKCRVLKGGQLKGEVLPVTLSVLCSLCGSRYLPDMKGKILILEDINENPYRIDAYMSQLKLNGMLNAVSGLVFGDFHNCGTENELDYIYNKYYDFVNGPVISGLPFGHCLPRLSLPVGEELNIEL